MDFSAFLAGVTPPVIDPLGAGAVVPVIDMSTISNPLTRVDFNLGLPLLTGAAMPPAADTAKASISKQLQTETLTVNTEPENTQSVPKIELQHQDIITPQERISRVNLLEQGIPAKRLTTSKPVIVSEHSLREQTVSLSSAQEKVSSIKSKRPLYRGGKVLVRFGEGVSGADAQNRFQSVHKLSKTKHFPIISRVMGKEYMLVEQEGKSAKDLIEILKNDPLVEEVSLDYTGEFFSDLPENIPDDYMFNAQWALHNTGQYFVCFGPNPEDCLSGIPDADIDAPEAWEQRTSSENAVVAVVDTGVAYDHPDLVENMWTNPDELYGDPGVDDDKNGYVDDIYGFDTGEDDPDPLDYNGHGTMVAGLIGARGNNSQGISGVNWQSRIMAIKIAPAPLENWLYLSDVIEAIEYILYWKEAGENIVAMNASWGFYFEYVSPEGIEIFLKNAIEALGRKGINVAAAVGNDGMDNDDGFFDPYPASFDLPNVISVAATDCNDYLTWWSNYGPISVDLAAPGDYVMSTFYGNYNLPGSGGDVFFDGMESGDGNWQAEGTWQVTEENYFPLSPTHAWSDSPGGNYEIGKWYELTTKPIDLSGESGPLHLGHALDIDMELTYDSAAYLEIFFRALKPSLWQKTSVKAHDKSKQAWTTDDPSKEYPVNTYSWLVSPAIDIRGDDIAILTFWLTGRIEEGWDKLHVFFSADGGENWDPMGFLTGDLSDQWYPVSAYIPPSYRTSMFKFAFVLESDIIVVYEGYYIDDIGIQSDSTVYFYDDVESDKYTWSRPSMPYWDYIGPYAGYSGGWVIDSVPLYEDCYWDQFQVKYVFNSLYAKYPDIFDGVYLDNIGIGPPEAIYDYAYLSGTSASAPLVTGALALLAAEHPNEGPYTLKNRILDGVDPLESLEGMVATGGRLNLYNSITLETPSYLQQINNILDFFDQSVEDERLWGTGPTSKVAGQRIKTIGDQIKRAVTLIDSGKPEKACGLLLNIYNLTDGASVPPDFVAGPAASYLAFMIMDLRINLGCP